MKSTLLIATATALFASSSASGQALVGKQVPPGWTNNPQKPSDVTPYTPRCVHGQSETFVPQGYDSIDFGSEVAYYVIIKPGVGCTGVAEIRAEEHGQDTHGNDGATLRVFFGDQGAIPSQELCRANDGPELPPKPHIPPQPTGYWTSGIENFNHYNLLCKTYSKENPTSPMGANKTVQFTMLRWNVNAQPNDYPNGVKFDVVFTPN